VRDVDVNVSVTGIILPGTGGMSVAPDRPENLHQSFKPSRFGGTGSKPVWVLDVADLPKELVYRPDPKKPSTHGFIEPAVSCTRIDYEKALASLADKWVLI